MKNINSNWYVGNMDNHQGLIIDEVTGENIAVTYKKENAQLVASAPELLEACKEVCACVYRNGELTFENSAWKLLIQAIEKAMGLEINEREMPEYEQEVVKDMIIQGYI